MERELPAPVPLGPESILGHLVTDARQYLTGFSTGLLQLLHPAVSAGVIQGSRFYEDPFDRVYRSVPRIVATVNAIDADERALKVRDYHKPIKGNDAHGNRFHALDPDVYWWTHQCFVWGYWRIADRLSHRPLDQAERDQFYAESVQWWRRYGMSMRPVQPTFDAFMDDFKQRCSRLEMTEAAEFALSVKVFRAPYRPPLDRIVGFPGTVPARIAMIGTLPTSVRERFDIPWSVVDRTAYAAMVQSAKNFGRVMPPELAQRAATRRLKQLGKRTSLTSEAGAVQTPR